MPTTCLASSRVLALAMAAALGLAGVAAAQDGASPRETPDGFVLPGPPPTGAAPTDPAPTGAAPGGAAAPPPAASDGMATQRPEQLAIVPEAGTTDWPCVQRKVEEIAPAAIWNGPDLGLAAGVTRDADMKALVETLASRRTALATAQADASAFVGGLAAEQRGPAAAALFTDLLARLNTERARIIRGIERYGARQKAFAQALRERHAKFDELRAGGADPAAVAEARDALLLDQRLFDERRQSLTYVCEVPVLIEQRAFAVGRTLADAVEG